MSAQAVIKIGPHGGKIVGFHNGKPVYAGSPEAAKLTHQAPEGSPALHAHHHDLVVAVHPTQHDHLQVAIRGPGAQTKMEAWAKASGGLPAGSHITSSSIGAHAIVPRAWAEKGTAPSVPAPTPPAPAAPPKKRPPEPSAVSPVLAQAGVTAASKADLSNPVKKWQDSPRHPVTVGGKKGLLVGWHTEGAPPSKTGKLVVLYPGAGPLGGFLSAHHPSEVTPDHGEPNAPWHNEDVKVFKSEAVTAGIKATLAQAAPGQKGKTMAEVIDTIRDTGVPVYLMGGFVRDALQGKESKDIDLGFGADAGEIVSIAMKKKLAFEHPGPGGLVKLGKPDGSGVPPLEGKALFGVNADRVKITGAPSSTGSDLHAENIYGDFCHGRLWYDPVNDTIVDPTGHGVEDALTHTLRIPVPKEQWEAWANGSPAKIWRYWKFVARGDKPADEDTRQFIVKKAKEFYGSGSQWVSPSATSAAMWKGIMAESKGPASKKKLADFKAAVIADMGAEWYGKHFAPYEP